MKNVTIKQARQNAAYWAHFVRSKNFNRKVAFYRTAEIMLSHWRMVILHKKNLIKKT